MNKNKIIAPAKVKESVSTTVSTTVAPFASLKTIEHLTTHKQWFQSHPSYNNLLRGWTNAVYMLSEYLYLHHVMEGSKPDSNLIPFFRACIRLALFVPTQIHLYINNYYEQFYREDASINWDTLKASMLPHDAVISTVLFNRLSDHMDVHSHVNPYPVEWHERFKYIEQFHHIGIISLYNEFKELLRSHHVKRFHLSNKMSHKALNTYTDASFSTWFQNMLIIGKLVNEDFLRSLKT